MLLKNNKKMDIKERIYIVGFVLIENIKIRFITKAMATEI